MSYHEFINHIGVVFENKIKEMSSIYNFEIGVEFEIAICKVLRALLPYKYGICRGHIITIEDETAGDDIIIYDQIKYPTLRLLDNKDYAQKQYIPIEAVYAYIEAKHTIILNDNEPNSLIKAWKQSISPKYLKRENVALGFENNIRINIKGIPLEFRRADSWPQYYNPMYTAIISRGIKLKKDGELIDCLAESELIYKKTCELKLQFDYSPDLIILNSDCGFLPCILNSKEERYSLFSSPFYVNGKSLLTPYKRIGTGFGIGIASLLFALESIKLGKIEWKKVIVKTLGLYNADDIE